MQPHIKTALWVVIALLFVGGVFYSEYKIFITEQKVDGLISFINQQLAKSQPASTTAAQ